MQKRLVEKSILAYSREMLLKAIILNISNLYFKIYGVDLMTTYMCVGAISMNLNVWIQAR